MFNLLKSKKEYKPISEYTEGWNILEDQNNQMIIRVSSGYKDAAGHPDYPIKMGVAVPLNYTDGEMIGNLKNSIEDSIEGILNKGEKGVLVTIITSLGEQKFLEFVSYTKSELDFKSLHEQLINTFPKEEVQMYAERDLKWDTYLSFLK